MVNPDRVLLGGLYRELLAAAPERLRAAVAHGSPWGSGAAIAIEGCTLEHAALIGAAEVAWQPVLGQPGSACATPSDCRCGPEGRAVSSQSVLAGSRYHN